MPGPVPELAHLTDDGFGTVRDTLTNNVEKSRPPHTEWCEGQVVGVLLAIPSDEPDVVPSSWAESSRRIPCDVLHVTERDWWIVDRLKFHRFGAQDEAPVAGDEVTVKWGSTATVPPSARATVLASDASVVVLALAPSSGRLPAIGSHLALYRATGNATIVFVCRLRDTKVRLGQRPLLVCRPPSRVSVLDRRAHPRANRPLDARIHRDGHRAVPAEVVDVSAGGLALRTTWDATPGKHLTISLVLPGAENTRIGLTVIARESLVPGGQVQLLRCRFTHRTSASVTTLLLPYIPPTS